MAEDPLLLPLVTDLGDRGIEKNDFIEQLGVYRYPERSRTNRERTKVAIRPLQAELVCQSLILKPALQSPRLTLPMEICTGTVWGLWPHWASHDSLEVAVAGDGVRALDTWQRDVVVVYALLHDIGKIWSYSDGKLKAEARRLGHEAIGCQRLAPWLASLRQDDASSRCPLFRLLLALRVLLTPLSGSPASFHRFD